MSTSFQATRWLIVPMEIVERELPANLLLCAEAVKHGWQCIIGTKAAIFQNASNLPSGVVFLKSVIPSEIGNINMLKNAGHKLVCLDAEGVIQDSLQTLLTRYSPETVKETDKLFCWGDTQLKVFKETFPEDADKFVTTGGITADLWSPSMSSLYEESAIEIRKQHGRYILLPSSFAVPNHFMGPEAYLGIMERDKMFKTKEEYEQFKSYGEHVREIFPHFVDFLPKLAEHFKDHTIIIRPHPSEAHETWHQAAQGYSNVKVVFEGSVSPWLFGADAILHWGSTTGLEAHLMERPVVAYSPYEHRKSEERFDILPHTVSILTGNEKETVEALEHVISESEKQWQDRYPAVAEGHSRLKDWVYNIDGQMAVDQIIMHLQEIDLPESTAESVIIHDQKKRSFQEIIWKCLEVIASMPGGQILNRIERIQIGLSSRAYGRHKTKDIDEKSVQNLVRLLSKIRSVENMHATQLAKNVYRVGAN